MTSRALFKPLQWGLALAGLLLVGSWARAELSARAYQRTESASLERELSRERSGLEVATVHNDAIPPGGPGQMLADPGRVLGRLEIPRLRIKAIVAEGVDEKTLGHAVGHVTATALPGGPGNCALAGHRDSFLRGLGNVRLRDSIRIVTSERTYFYEVEWTGVVAPRRIDVLEPTPARCVTLITCFPFRYIGHAPSRFIVRARQVDVGRAPQEGGS